MDVIDADTGKSFRLDTLDEAYCRDIEEHNAKYACGHAAQELRRSAVGSNNFQHRFQCLRCGEFVGTAVKQEKSTAPLPDADINLRGKYSTDRSQDRAHIVQKHVRKQKAKETAFWKKYNAYLRSPEWQVKRDLVLKRANGQCEGCAQKSATQVHHQTYRNVFKEFLFQLVAVCDECHERYHRPADGETEIVQLDENYEPPCCACRWQSQQSGQDWCVQFDTATRDALAEGGPCGPRLAALEPLK